MLPDAIPVIIHLREADLPIRKHPKQRAALCVVSLKLELRVGQENCSPASLSCKATWDSPRIVSWLVFGGYWSRMKPWCRSKVKEGQEKRSFQFQLPQHIYMKELGVGTGLQLEILKLKALTVLEAPESNPWAFPLRHSFFLNSLHLASY